jgi:uncharacterized membrane protein
VAQPERVVSVLIGTLLAYYGLRHRRSAVGLASSTVGGLMLERGVSGRCMAYSALGVDTATPRAVEVHEVMQLMKPRQEVYSFWRDLANLPRFMRHVRSVEPRAGGVSHWRVQVSPGPELEWDARIVDDNRGERISWRTTDEAEVDNAGEIRFVDMPAGRGTGIEVRITYQPPVGPIGAAAAHLLRGVTAQQIREDLRRFKAVLEAGEAPTVHGQPSGRPRDRERVEEITTPERGDVFERAGRASAMREGGRS